MFLPSVQQNSYLKDSFKVAIAYFLSGFLTLTLLQDHIMASPLWLPAGVGLGMMIFSKNKGVWGVFWGDFFLTLSLGESLSVSVVSALGSTLGIALAVKGLDHAHFSPSLTRLRDAIALILIGAMLAPLVNASLYCLIKGIFREFDGDLGIKWFLLWLGDCTGILMITPLICCVKTESWRSLQLQHRWQEGLTCFSLLLGFSWLVFAAPISSQFLAEGGYMNAQYLEYLPFPFLVWAALRFQIFGAILASLLVSSLATTGTLQDIGAFALQTPNRSLAILLLQVFTTIITSTALLLSSSVTERKQVTEKLQKSLEQDRLLGEISTNIRQSLDLTTILETTVTEIQNLLKTDRTYISYLTPEGQLQVLAESVNPRYPSLKGWKYPSDFLQDIQGVLKGNKTIVNNKQGEIDITPSIQSFIEQYQIQASLIVPLQIKHQSLGLLVINQCGYMREWQLSDIQLLERLATQVSIAIQQAQLYQTVQQLNENLERQVEERTVQLEEKIEELQEFYDMRTVFLQGISHDLKTSMMGLSLLLNHLKSPTQTEIHLTPQLLQRISYSCDRALTLINALSEEQLDQKTALSLNLQPINLTNFLNALISQWQPLLESYQATLTTDIETEIPLINLDPLYLQQVFDNLLQNALKHNPPGRKITIKVRNQENQLECAIIDDGIGLESSQQAQLFKLYVRNLQNSRLTGIGLGCYQAKQMIEAHGGKIGVESISKLGSRFWFTLPLNRSQIISNK